MEVDPSGVLALADESLVERGNDKSNVAPDDEEKPVSRVDQIIRSELKEEKRIVSVNKRQLCDVDADVLYERPLKCVAFQVDDDGGRLSSAGCELVGWPCQKLGSVFPVVSDQMVLLI